MLLFAADHAVLPADARVTGSARGSATARRTPSSASSRGRSRMRSTRELPPSVEAFRRAFLYLSHHGGATCTESDPHCVVCPLLTDCPEGQNESRDARLLNG